MIIDVMPLASIASISERSRMFLRINAQSLWKRVTCRIYIT